MTTWRRRTRAAISMGLTWAVAWFAGGLLLARVPGFASDLPFALLFAPLGFMMGILFSTILVTVALRRGLEHTSLPRFAGWGAVSGLLLSGIFVAFAASRGAALWTEFMLFAPPLAIAGAACATASLAMARRAERHALSAESTRRAISP